MTTLLRRLAERAVRATLPPPAPTMDGFEVVDDERTVATPAQVASAPAADPAALLPGSPPTPPAPDEASRRVGDVVVPQRSVERAPSRPEVSTSVVAAPASAPPGESPVVPRVPATGRPPGASARAVAAAVPAPSAEAIVPAVPVSMPLWRARVPARRDDAAAGTISDDERPTVQVRIGRLDVRAVPPPSSRVTQRPEPERDASAELALSDYLRGKRMPR